MANSRFSSAAWWLGTLISSGGKDTAIPHVVLDDGTGTPAPSGTSAAPMFFASANPATIYTAQQAVTASAVALAAHALVNGVVVKAKTTNTGTVYVGPTGVTTSTGYPLAPGESISFGVTDASAVFVIVAVLASDGVSVAGN